MPTLGTFVLLASFVACAYAIAASVAGARRRSNRLVESGIGAFYFITALMTVATGVIVHAFVTDNYAIKYVQRYSETAQPLAYKLASYWGGLDHVLGLAPGDLRITCRLPEPRKASRADSLRGGRHRSDGDVLSVPDDRAQQPVLDLPHAAAR
jgi:hypothetical protein